MMQSKRMAYDTLSGQAEICLRRQDYQKIYRHRTQIDFTQKYYQYTALHRRQIQLQMGR